MGKIAAIANQMRGNWQGWLLCFFTNGIVEIFFISNVIKSIKEKKIFDLILNVLSLVFLNISDAVLFYCYLVDIGIY